MEAEQLDPVHLHIFSYAVLSSFLSFKKDSRVDMHAAVFFRGI